MVLSKTKLYRSDRNTLMTAKEQTEAEFRELRKKFEENWEELLEKSSFRNAPQALQEAVLYSLKAGGKRLRPVLFLEASRLNSINEESSLKGALAFELLHTYSLVHDDLPALDDDDYRRGILTSHKKFGEDVAILVGDALQSLAFELLALADFSAASLAEFARAVGPDGMVGGQYLDVKQSTKSLRDMHLRKTGRLIEASLAIPFFEKSNPAYRDVRKWGALLGLLFQVTDDILDATATREELGKTPGKDSASGKKTYVELYGLEGAQRKSQSIVNVLKETAEKKISGSPLLQGMPEWILSRRN